MLDKKPIVCPQCKTVYGVYVCTLEHLPCLMVKTCPMTVLTKLTKEGELMAKKAKQNEAQEYLLQVKKLDANIDSKLEQVAHLKAMTTKITTTLKQDVVSGSGNQDKIGDAIAKIIDLEAEINRDIDAYVDKKREICMVIEAVSDPDQMAVLQKRYLLYESWEQIALEMHCTYRNVCYIHGRALQAVMELMKERNQNVG